MFKITKLLTKNILATTFLVSSLHRIRCISGYEIVNNATLFYEKHGMNPNKIVLCVPGALGTTQSDFSYQLKEMSKDFTMISFDPRGFGKSKKVTRNFNENFYEADANDGIQLMKKLGLYILRPLLNIQYLGDVCLCWSLKLNCLNVKLQLGITMKQFERLNKKHKKLIIYWFHMV